VTGPTRILPPLTLRPLTLHAPDSPAGRAAAILVVALLAGGAAACSTKRVLTIQSDPPGARVFVDGVERGTTPLAVPFVHPGRFHVRLEKAGYQSLAGHVEVPSGAHDLPVVDLPFELAVAQRGYAWTGRLAPIVRQPTAADARAVFDRARAFREETNRALAEPGTPTRSRP